MRDDWELSVKSQYFAGNDDLGNDSEQLVELTKRMRKFIKKNPGLEIVGFATERDSEFGWNGMVTWYGGLL